MSHDCGFNFEDKLDCAGGNMWIWHRKMTAENGGLGVLKEATVTLSVADLPPDWRNTFAKQAKKNESDSQASAQKARR